MLDENAILIDIREPDERARAYIAGTKNVPLFTVRRRRFDRLSRPAGGVPLPKRRARTLANAARLAAKAGEACEAYFIDGGLDAWRKAGLPVINEPRHRWNCSVRCRLRRAASALFGTLFGLLLSPWFFAVPLFVGAGLTTAGVTGFCGIKARLLAHMPWNRATYLPQAQRV